MVVGILLKRLSIQICAQVAQLVEHATENRGVGSSILPLGTTEYPKNPPSLAGLSIQCDRTIESFDRRIDSTPDGFALMNRSIRSHTSDVTAGGCG